MNAADKQARRDAVQRMKAQASATWHATHGTQLDLFATTMPPHDEPHEDTHDEPIHYYERHALGGWCTVTEAQSRALDRIAQRWDLPRNTVQVHSTVGCDGAIMIGVRSALTDAPLWIGIEVDGYAHS